MDSDGDWSNLLSFLVIHSGNPPRYNISDPAPLSSFFDMARELLTSCEICRTPFKMEQRRELSENPSRQVPWLVMPALRMVCRS
ncbi:hypothetical protein ZOSMA_181G00040 [Zostera marina]|uniref:Uncharacterized protein n=1 Tax=Zostera marina TaxID=29655 RepID=A0A0K9PQX5_ZOSMR|nr:hypothetical protein ZOSMA_181G00040 [Zostera marina]